MFGVRNAGIRIENARALLSGRGRRVNTDSSNERESIPDCLCTLRKRISGGQVCGAVRREIALRTPGRSCGAAGRSESCESNLRGSAKGGSRRGDVQRQKIPLATSPRGENEQSSTPRLLRGGEWSSAVYRPCSLERDDGARRSQLGRKIFRDEQLRPQLA